MSLRSCTRACALGLLLLWSCGPSWAAGDDAQDAMMPPRTVKDYGERGAQLYQAGKYEEAALAFEGAYALRPNAIFLFNIAQAQRKAGHLREALALYERFLREDPGSPLRAEVLGYLPELRGRTGSAPEPGLMPRTVKDYSELGAQLYQAGEYGRSAQAFEIAYALSPHAIFLFNIAQAQRKAGRYREALALYEHYLQADPQTAMAAEVGGYMKEARIRIEAGYKAQEMRTQAASQLAGNRPRQSPKMPKPLYKRAWFWGVLGGVTVAIVVGVTLGVELRPQP